MSSFHTAYIIFLIDTPTQKISRIGIWHSPNIRINLKTEILAIWHEFESTTYRDARRKAIEFLDDNISAQWVRDCGLWKGENGHWGDHAIYGELSDPGILQNP